MKFELYIVYNDGHNEKHIVESFLIDDCLVEWDKEWTYNTWWKDVKTVRIERIGDD